VLLPRGHPTLAAEGHIVTVIDELGVLADQDIIVIRTVLTDTEALETVGNEVFQVRQLIKEGLVDDDGVFGESVDAISDGPG
jgi:hypothetical protein